MNENIGRIIGESVREIRFRAAHGKDIFLGEILICTDPTNGRDFLLRVFDIQMGFEASDMDWAARTAGNMLSLEENNMKFDISDSQRRLYKVGVCKSLGYVENDNFRKPKTMPAHFGAIRRASREDLKLLKDFVGDIVVGKLRSGEKTVDISTGVHSRDLSSHMGVFATTGMGKSNLMKRFASSCIESGQMGLLIFDPHGEYYSGGASELKGLVHHPDQENNLRVFSARKLPGPYEAIRISSKEVEVEDLKHLYEFSTAQNDALGSARRIYGDNWITTLSERNIDDVARDLEGTGHATIGVIRRKLKNLFSFNLLHRDPNITITNRIIHYLQEGKTVLVDTSCMGEAEELLISIVVARSLFRYHKWKYTNPAEFEKMTPVLITVEEAQRVLGRTGFGNHGARQNIHSQIAREGRKFKVGICAITQQPKLIDEEIISQFNTLFIMGLGDKKDREILKHSAKQDISGLGAEIQMLMPGEGLVTSVSLPFALPIKIDLFEEYLMAITPDGNTQLRNNIERGGNILQSFLNEQ